MSQSIARRPEPEWPESPPKQNNGPTNYKIVKYAFDNPLTPVVTQDEELYMQSLPIASNKNLPDTAHESTNSSIRKQDKPFRLLDLPRELRDLIFEQTVRISKTAGLRNTKGAQISPPSSRYATSNCMVLVNKQIHEEYIEHLCSAPEIVVNVQISNLLNFQHAIEMIEGWPTRRNGSLAKCPQKLTINFVLYDWCEFLIHPDEYEENTRQTTESVKQWLRIATRISKFPNAPTINYTAQGTSNDLWDCMGLAKKLDLTTEAPGCDTQRIAMIRDIRIVSSILEFWELEQHRKIYRH